jgi:hypothetical protein
VTTGDERTPSAQPQVDAGDGLERRGPAVLGAILIILGAIFLAGQLFDFDIGEVGWPFFVIAPGVVLLVLGLTMRDATPMIIAGSVVTTVGLVLLYQNTTDHWESWAYAWALVGPTAAGAGSVLAGTRNGNRGLVRTGFWQALVGLALFAAGLFFFEGIIGISGRRLPLPEWVLPAAIVVAGAVLIVWSLAGRRTATDAP